MVQYFSPGVKVEFVDRGARPIQGASTSVTGAVGVTVRGPTTGKPVLVTSYAEFTRTFGGFLDDPSAAVQAKWDDTGFQGAWWRFPLAVRGFFENGGKQLYVKRVFAGTAAASSADLFRGVISEVTKSAAPGDTVTLRHLFGITTGSTLDLVNKRTGQKYQDAGGGTTFTVKQYDAATGQVTFTTAFVGDASDSRGDFAIVKAQDTAAGKETLAFTAVAKGKWGDDVQVRVRPVGFGDATSLTLLADPGLDPTPVTTSLKTALVEVPGTDGGTFTVNNPQIKNNDWVDVLGGRYRVATTATAGEFKITAAIPNGPQWTVGTTVRKVRLAANPASTVIKARGAGRVLYPDALVELDNGTDKEVLQVTSVSGDDITLAATKPTKVYFEDQRLRLVEAEVSVRYVRTVGGVEQVEATEEFKNLRLAAAADPLHLVNVVNSRSALVRVVNNAGTLANLAALPLAKSLPWEPLTGGDDKYEELKPGDFIGEDKGSGLRTGVTALEDITDLSLVVVPGVWSPAVVNAAVSHCENLKYRFFLTDPPPKKAATTSPIQDVMAHRANFDTTYAALYYPWLVVRDAAGAAVVCPPSAHMAGLYARVDGERGVQKAPANEIVRGILGFEQDVTEREQDLLNPRGINALRFFPGRGLRCWGARTLSSSDANFRYVNVRRIFNFIGKSIDDGTQFTVFEPNDDLLWSRVRQTVGNFLDTQWRSGVLEGKTADDAFFVNCDRGLTMTQTDIENGYLICEVGISPVYPAEFVVFRIQKYVSASKQSA